MSHPEGESGIVWQTEYIGTNVTTEANQEVANPVTEDEMEDNTDMSDVELGVSKGMLVHCPILLVSP